MIDLTRLLPKIVQANPEVAVKMAWARAAGEGMRRNAIASRLHDSTLYVSVADAMWQRQLQSMRAELIFRINNLLGRKAIDEIVFRVAPSDVAKESTNHDDDSPKPAPQPLPSQLLFAANSIDDEDLRARFLRAADNLIARRDARPSND